MDAQHSEQRTALFRQRRFLIVVSIAVMAFYWLDVEIKDEAVFSGFGFKINNTGRLIPLLWGVWTWAAWRYWQRAYELLSALRDELAEDVFAEDMRIALAYAKKFGNNLAAAGRIDDGLPRTARIDGKASVDRPDPEEVNANEALGIKMNYFRGFITTTNGSRRYPLKADFAWIEGVQFRDRAKTFTMEVSAARATWFRARAWVYAVLSLPAFSEHFAPFLIALPPLWLGIRELALLILPDGPR